jgi:putative transposase
MEQQSVHKTFNYLLMPTPAQEQALDLVVSRCRTLYNVAIEQCKTWWERGQSMGATYYQQKAELSDLKAAWRNTPKSRQVLQDVILRVERTYHTFFRRVQAGETLGYPQYGVHGGALLDGSVLSLSKIGRIRIRLHRPLQGTPKTVTISREADGWYACISCAEVTTSPLPLTGQETGIDMGFKVFLITAGGEIIENPRHYRKAERQLATAQRRVGHRKKGSKRRKKAVALLKRKHQKVHRQRRDVHHKAARALLRTYDTIYLEDLQVRTMVRNHYLAKCISDASWAAFRTILAFKAACAGKWVLAVPPAYTSQDCSGCGKRVLKSLSVRTHVCPRSGLVLDCDENAARNMARAGQARQGAVAVAAVVN